MYVIQDGREIEQNDRTGRGREDRYRTRDENKNTLSNTSTKHGVGG